jgi:hypothetical protein
MQYADSPSKKQGQILLTNNITSMHCKYVHLFLFHNSNAKLLFLF